MFLSEWREFPSAPCLAGGKKLDDSSRLDVVEIARVAWYASFSFCNKKRRAIRHINRTLFPKTLSIPSYDIEKYVCRAKNLSAQPRSWNTYRASAWSAQHTEKMKDVVKIG